MRKNLINCLVVNSNMEVTFTKEQWKSYINKERNLLSIKLENDYNIRTDFSLAKYAKKNDINFNYKPLVIFGLALTLILVNSNLMAFASEVIPDAATKGLGDLGQKFVDVIQEAGYWICFCKGLIDIIKEILKGGDKADGIGKILIRYTIAFASFYLFPYVFDLIRTSFA